jgi:hypothetical protein
MLGSSSVLVSQWVWDKHFILPFQFFVLSLSFLCFSFNITDSSLSSHLFSSLTYHHKQLSKGQQGEWEEGERGITEKPSLPPNFRNFIKDIFTLRKF